jgi:outer membrane protein assembly factor BamA
VKSKFANSNIFIFFLLFGFITSCSSVRKVPDVAYLLKKNKININNADISKEKIDGLIKQKANKKFIGIKFKLAFYNLAKKDNPGKFSRFLLRIGEAPVIYDSVAANNTIKRINLFMDNHGYFKSEVYKKLVYSSKKKAIVNYFINASQPYRIKDIVYMIEDENIKNEIYSKLSNSIIKKNSIYEIDKLDKERERITTLLKNMGYFEFSRDFISYSVDSSLNNHQMNVVLQVKNPRINSRNRLKHSNFHKKYKIRNIYIYPDYNPLVSDTISKDTALLEIPQYRNKLLVNRYLFVYNNEIKIRPRTFSQSIFINSNDYFNLKDVEQTYNRLSDLKNFRFINISFDESTEDTLDLLKKEGILDCKIELSKNKVNYLSTELEGSNSSGYYGIAGNLVFQNKNLFKGAEILNVKLRAVLENQNVISTITSADKPLFNTFETGIDVNIEIPKFLIPIKQEYFSKYFKPKSTISFGFNFQDRPDFRRTITNLGFGYDWRQSTNIQHIFTPISINSVKIYPDSVFKASIDLIADKRLKYQYTDHFILSLKYSFIYTNQEVNKKESFTFFRLNLETAGNVLNLYKRLFDNQRNSDGDFEVFNLIYSQYSRIDFDLRRYIIFNNKNSLVLRTAMGWGMPYGNSKQLPYEKSFIAGGANDIRAWRLRSLGPGSYTDSKLDNFDRIGDISMEFNIENRFPIYKILHGALFIDAGNIWLNKANTQFPGGEFLIDKFLSQIAIGGGFGVRLDFSYFIIRIDAAIPFKDPSKSNERQWVIANSGLRDFVVNFGIGYSF